jgi:hypothetical protein
VRARIVDLRDHAPHGLFVTEIDGDIRVVGTGRTLDVEHRDVRRVELGEDVEQRRTNTGCATGDDDAPAFILNGCVTTGTRRTPPDMATTDCSYRCS